MSPSFSSFLYVIKTESKRPIVVRLNNCWVKQIQNVYIFCLATFSLLPFNSYFLIYEASASFMVHVNFSGVQSWSLSSDYNLFTVIEIHQYCYKKKNKEPVLSIKITTFFLCIFMLMLLYFIMNYHHFNVLLIYLYTCIQPVMNHDRTVVLEYPLVALERCTDQNVLPFCIKVAHNLI